MAPANLLTDARLKQLYYEIADDYSYLCDIKEPYKLNQAQIAEELNRRLYNSLVNPGCPLYNLLDEEKNKAFTVLNTYLRACQYNATIHVQNNQLITNFSFQNPPPTTPPTYVIIDARPRRSYCASNDFLLTWMLFNNLGRSYHPRHPTSIYWPSSQNTHSHPSKKEDKDAQAAQFWALLIVIGIVISAIASAFIALYYLLNEIKSNIDRFIYNEGWMQALVSLSSIAASGFMSFMIANTIATIPLIELGITAGLANPAGLAVFGVLTLSLVGAAVGGYLTNFVQNYIISSSNQDSLDPNDPHRFEITDQETHDLILKGLDPIKVKCAIVALRAEIGKEEIPGVIDRLFIQRGGRITECLNQIRQLRKGNLAIVGVGNLTFDCHRDAVVTRQAQAPQLGQRFFVPRQIFADTVLSVMPAAPYVSTEDQQKPMSVTTEPADVALDLNVAILPPSAPPSEELEPTVAVVAANGSIIDDEDENPRPVASQFG